MRDNGAMPLRGIRVVELSSSIPAATCGQQLALYGADVITIESRSNCAIRSFEPKSRNESGDCASELWSYLCENKRIAKCCEAADIDDLEELLRKADVLITDHDRNDLKLIGIVPGEISSQYPNLCVVSVTPFGLEGPYSEYQSSELVVQALSGYLKMMVSRMKRR